MHHLLRDPGTGGPSFSTVLASSDVAQIRNLQPVSLHWLLGPQRHLKQMGQNSAGAKMYLALQHQLGKRVVAFQHITLPHRGTAVHSRYQPRVDRHRAASRDTPMGAKLSAGTWDKVDCRPTQDLLGTHAGHFGGWKARFSYDCSQRTEVPGLEHRRAGQATDPPCCCCDVWVSTACDAGEPVGSLGWGEGKLYVWSGDYTRPEAVQSLAGWHGWKAEAALLG